MRQGRSERCGAFLLHCNGLAEERKEMVSLMNDIMEGWQEMDGKDKVACVVDKARENGMEWKGTKGSGEAV